eukprot:scaffold3.g6629.t1
MEAAGSRVDRRHIDWESLDKTKFFAVGVGLFSSITVALYPLSVVKTRMMALDGAGDMGMGLRGAYRTAQTVVQHDGLRGLWKGFGTVVGGMIPARMIYLYSLEYTRGVAAHALEAARVPETAAAGASSFLGGAMASLASQLVVVPIDVVSQRLMIRGGGAPPPPPPAAATVQAGAGGGAAAAAAAAAPARVTGLLLAQQIVRAEGVLGLYRGFWASAATFVPNSACWWAAYGAWQASIWHTLDAWATAGGGAAVAAAPPPQRTDGEIAAVQATAGILTGFTTALVTNPLDVAKTRLQTAAAAGGGARPTWAGVVRQLYATHGAAGFYRGVQPRMLSSAMWGTAMVSAYELLKRMCAATPPPA